MRPGGRVVCISFHSLEDRIVKRFFQEQEAKGTMAIVTSGAVVASTSEIQENPSARSAKLRAAQMLQEVKKS